jgi:murein L,D-transpeptidase YcbB/YkuD
MNFRSLLIIFCSSLLLLPPNAHSKSLFSGIFKKDKAQKIETPAEPVQLSALRIVVNVPARTLKFYRGEKLISDHKVAVGEPNFPSPIGQRLMNRIVWNPWWIPPKKISQWAEAYEDTPPGAENPLGPVKMDIQDLYYIHGNNDPISIGHAVTHGCIRLLDDEAVIIARKIVKEAAPSMSLAKLDVSLGKNEENIVVLLDHPVIVDVLYELVELKNNKIYVYDDVYSQNGKPQHMIESALVSAGVPINKIRSQLLKRDLKFLKGQRELVFPFSKYVKNFKFQDLAANKPIIDSEAP